MGDVAALERRIALHAGALQTAIRMVERTDDRGARAVWEAEVQHLGGKLAQARREWWAAGGALKLIQGVRDA